MLKMGLHLSGYFSQMNWVIFRAPEKSAFITSDNPLVVIPSPDSGSPYGGVGFATPGALKILSLNQKVCIGLEDKGDMVYQARIGNSRLIRYFNYQIAAHCDRFTMSHSPELLKRIAKQINLKNINSGPRVEIA